MGREEEGEADEPRRHRRGPTDKQKCMIPARCTMIKALFGSPVFLKRRLGNTLHCSAYFFWWWLSEIHKKYHVAQFQLVVFSSSACAERSAYFQADVGSILCGSFRNTGGPNGA